MGGNAEKLTNHVMGVTARFSIQPISERFRSGNGQKGLDTTPTGKAMFQMMDIFAEFERAHRPGTSPCRACAGQERGEATRASAWRHARDNPTRAPSAPRL